MSRSRERLWLVLPALLALVWFWPTLSHGFRSDDFLTVYYYDRDAAGVHWDRVFGEWGRPWFGVRDLYRPFVSLTFGANWALSTSPLGFHLLNVLLLAGTATAVAAAGARLAPASPRLVGLVAAAVVVLHPAAVEPTAWIAARTTGLQVFWSAVAYWGFLRFRDGRGGRWLPLLATALACASKEGAVLLPASFVALDLLRGSRPQVRTHAPFLALVAAYLVFRWFLLGVVTTAEEGHTIGERLHGAWSLCRQLVQPPAGGAVAGAWPLLPFGLLLAVALVVARSTLWCLPWVFLLLLPGTTHVQVGDELAGRFVFDAVPALALFAALGLSRARPVAAAAVAAAAVVAFGSLLAVQARGHLRLYADQDRLIAKVQQELLAAAADAGPARPFGVVGLPKLPLLQPALWGFLTQRPFAPVDQPVVGLENMLARDPAAPGVFGDAAAVHALVADGAGFGRWDPATEAIVRLPKAAPGAVEFAPVPGAPGRFTPVRPLSPAAVAALEVVAPRPVRAWRASILGNLEGDFAAAPFVRAAVGEPEATWWIDATRVLPWVVAAAFGGGPAGLDVQCDGAPAPPGTVVRAHAPLDLAGAPAFPPMAPSEVVDRAGFAARLAYPTWGEPPPETIYLLLPVGLYVGRRGPDGSAMFDGATRSQLDFACDVLGPCRVFWFWQSAPSAPHGRPRRTSFGSCVVR